MVDGSSKITCLGQKRASPSARPGKEQLIVAGHEVTGLARSDTAAAAVFALGAKVRRGGLDDLGGLKEAAADCDGIIHAAFNRGCCSPAESAR
jgi:hypothetical protein